MTKLLVFDLETTGIPKDRKATFRNLDVYDGARIVSVAWRLVDGETKEELRSRYYVVRPAGFEIPADSIAIHGITNEAAQADGVPLAQVIGEMADDIRACTVMVAHNIMFDMNILRSELYRLKKQRLIDMTFEKKIFCTMQQARKRGVTQRMPKLTDLYRLLCPDEPECDNAHNAFYDVLYCYKVYEKLVLIPEPLPLAEPLPMIVDETDEKITSTDDCCTGKIKSSGDIL